MRRLAGLAGRLELIVSQVAAGSPVTRFPAQMLQE